ncbi:Acetylesterase [Psilocybe cubensis]|uniref:Acetylesterase n=2 Tax=Psilocybe cubensis TaxID=181762 RepID=A0ACB8HDC8_PSICU|nr:Acetylesterase [Psilocybe cubensis]KAH9485803.1 Acetylesterase [Psilocybe cubensis]
MMRISSASLAFLVGVLPFALAQSPLYGQCGGTGWTGATTCVAGSVCNFYNEWYSQCIPGSATTSTASTPPPSSTSKTSTAPTSTPSSSVKPNYWFSFGDSYSQTGFDITGTLPNVANPIGNPDFPGWSATGGANWVGYLTATYNNSLLFTYNYAYGGATIDASLVAPYESTVLSLTDQVNQFLTTVASKPTSTPWTSENSLFSIWIGVNDIGNSYYLSGDRSAFSDTLLNAYFALVQKLYNAGGRNFLFANVPPIDRSPLMLAQSTDAQALEKSVIGTFNTKLVAKINSFAANNTGVKTFLWDSNAQFTAMLNSPTTYGFADATSYGSDPTMFWGNNYHPSTYANKFFGQTVGQNVLGKTIW